MKTIKTLQDLKNANIKRFVVGDSSTDKIDPDYPEQALLVFIKLGFNPPLKNVRIKGGQIHYRFVNLNDRNKTKTVTKSFKAYTDAEIRADVTHAVKSDLDFDVTITF